MQYDAVRKLSEPVHSRASMLGTSTHVMVNGVSITLYFPSGTWVPGDHLEPPRGTRQPAENADCGMVNSSSAATINAIVVTLDLPADLPGQLTQLTRTPGRYS